MSPRSEVASMRGQSIGPHWVRSWDTEVPVSRSQTELEQLLRRYGAKGYTLSADYTNGTVVIAFTIPRDWQDAALGTADVQMALGFANTLKRLRGMQKFKDKVSRMSSQNQQTWPMEQAERVAWRQLIMLVEAGLNAAASGLQTVEEAFFAHTMIQLGSGRHRAIDVVQEARKALPPGPSR